MQEINYHIQNIPCIINVTHVDGVNPDSGCTSSDMDFYGYFECEYEVLTTRGHRSKWLEKKITDAIDQEIKNMIEDTVS